MVKLKFALNHMVAPGLCVDAFLSLSVRLGVEAVELRNDLGDGTIAGGLQPEAVRDALSRYGLTLIAINALQRFNDWNAQRAHEAGELLDYAATAGAKAIVLVPTNDGGEISLEDLTASLNQLGMLLAHRAMIGLVEPLGFQSCSLRSKGLALEAIDASAYKNSFQLVHDTFHHVLAGEPEVYAQRSGLVHLSGVTVEGVKMADLRDCHRVLIDRDDRLDNIGQIKALVSSGYGGYFSFEPFSEGVHQSPDIEADLAATMAYLNRAVI